MFDQLNELSKATILSALRYWQQALADENNFAVASFVDGNIGTLTPDEIDELLVELGLHT